jgi:SAM-dependent methyltransferase
MQQDPATLDRLASRLAPSLAQDLLNIATPDRTEADFRREVVLLLDRVVSEAQIPLNVREEYHVARGRTDAVYNRLILEYKRPGILGEKLSGKGNQSAIEQVKDYILGVAKRERGEAHRLAGIAMDGRYFIFVRRVGEGWSDPEVLPVTPGSVERFLRLLFALAAGAALIPENLIQDFGPKNIEAQRAVRAIYRTLHASKHPLVMALFDQWRLFFSEATDYKELSERLEAKEEFRAFVRGVGLDPKYTEPAKVFFALHTYYAILIKLIASLAAARYAGGGTAPFSRMAAETPEELRRSFVSLEHGGLFREYGIRNFLEGDFFGWYLSAWDDDLYHELQRMVRRLSEYDPGSLELAPENARDLLKKLYHYLLPREIRHDLGEYYTPDWLAERLIRQTLTRDLGDPTKRVLDPACGSGTFLVLVINHIKREALRRRMGPTETLDAIRKNVIGFDLNPLAVIAARTNYLLALGDLLKETKRLGPEGIDIPVYQCDSVLTPTRGEGLYDHGRYRLKTSVGVFDVPETFATKERMEALANILDEAVESRVGEEAFFERLARTVDVYQKELDAAKPALTEVYRRLADLHAQGLNGVWARIMKNGFAPLFMEPVHYVIGNPPWINWENLPDEYRQRSIPTWQHYGLFPHGGMETILGKGKKDISMLMTYVSIDKYLLPRGKLGFVLSQSLFKTSGAGQGFRRFILPDRTTVGPLVVEDMVELKPFEGATNRTSVAVFGKGYPIRYPVPYSYWVKKKKGRGSAIGFDTPYEEVTKELVTFRKWDAEPVDAKDNTSAWVAARPKALRAIRKILGDYRHHIVN